MPGPPPAETLHGIQHGDPARFAALVGGLDANVQAAVQGMMQVGRRRVGGPCRHCAAKLACRAAPTMCRATLACIAPPAWAVAAAPCASACSLLAVHCFARALPRPLLQYAAQLKEEAAQKAAAEAAAAAANGRA